MAPGSFLVIDVDAHYSQHLNLVSSSLSSARSSCHCLLAGARWAGSESPSTTVSNRGSAWKTCQRDGVHGMPTHEQNVSLCCLLVIVYSRAYGGRGDRAHRPPFQTEVRHGQRPPGMMSAESLHTSIECAAQPVGGGPEPIDHRPERSSARNASPRVRKTAGCRLRSLRRTINHRLHPLLWLALETGGRGARAHRPPSRTEVRHGIVFPVDALAIFA